MASAALMLSGAVGWAAESVGAYEGALTITLENDVFTGSDNNYTNGLGLTWVSNAIGTYEETSFVRRWGEFWSFLPFASAQNPKAKGLVDDLSKSLGVKVKDKDVTLSLQVSAQAIGDLAGGDE